MQLALSLCSSRSLKANAPPNAYARIRPIMTVCLIDSTVRWPIFLSSRCPDVSSAAGSPLSSTRLFMSTASCAPLFRGASSAASARARDLYLASGVAIRSQGITAAPWPCSSPSPSPSPCLCQELRTKSEC